MANSLTNAGENVVATAVGNLAIYIGLFTTSPNWETGAGGTEASASPYARESVTWNAASDGVITSSNSQTWTVGANVAAGTYTGWGAFDDEDNLLFGDDFSASRTLSADGDFLQLPAGDLSYTQT